MIPNGGAFKATNALAIFVIYTEYLIAFASMSKSKIIIIKKKIKALVYQPYLITVPGRSYVSFFLPCDTLLSFLYTQDLF